MPAWTDDEVRDLRRLYGKAPWPELIAIFGRSHGAILVKAHYLGLRKRRALKSRQARASGRLGGLERGRRQRDGGISERSGGADVVGDTSA